MGNKSKGRYDKKMKLIRGAFGQCKARYAPPEPKAEKAVKLDFSDVISSKLEQIARDES